MKRILYYSTARENFTSEDLAGIVASAERNNPARGITGMLAFNSRHFLQTLEGAAVHVDEIMGRIFNDPRHTSLVVLKEQPIEATVFPSFQIVVERAPTGPEQNVQEIDSEAIQRLIAGLPEDLSAPFRNFRTFR